MSLSDLIPFREYVSISISLFAIMDPLAAIPTLISYIGAVLFLISGCWVMFL